MGAIVIANHRLGNLMASTVNVPTPERVAEALRIQLPIALSAPTPESVAELLLIGFAKALSAPTPDKVAAPL